ncbi:MAG: SMC-Scp complex subunit ScpB [Polyangiales bacterium]
MLERRKMPPSMAPEDDELDPLDDEGDPLGFHPDDAEGSGSAHSDSVFVVDDEESGRESFLERASEVFEEMVERAAFADDVAAVVFVDADPTARDAASGLVEEQPPALPEVDEAARRHLRGLLEALLFVSDRPMKAADLADVARADVKEVRSILEALSEEYREGQRGYQLDELAGGFQIRTAAAYAPFVRELTNAKPVRLSRAQVETLAIIAYRQPITRPEIEDIRGVDAGAVLKLLLDRDMVRILGKKDEPGRPLLYGTTTHFLTFFGLKTLKDLPTLREFTELTDESREVVERELGEVLPEGPREPVPAIPPEELRADTEEQARVEEPPAEIVEELERQATEENAAITEEEEEPSSDTQREPEPTIEARADNDTDEPAPAESSDEYKPGGASYDPSDEDEFPDDDDTDDEDEDEDEEDDDEEDEDDEDE